MSCNHFWETSNYIQKIIQETYPPIQYQLVLIGQYSNFECNSSEDIQANELWMLINELRSVFNSLSNYEIKLVFPSVLKYFDNNRSEHSERLPDIDELVSMTKAKEKEIQTLCSDIDNRLQKTDSTDFAQKENIQKIVSFFQNEFNDTKEKWYQILKDRTLICTGFHARFNISADNIKNS